MTYNFESIKIGDTYDGATFDVVRTPSPVVLTGAEIIFQVRKADVLYIEKRVGSGITISSAIQFILSPFIVVSNQTGIELTADTYDYDIQFIFTDGTVKTYISGTFTVIKDNNY